MIFRAGLLHGATSVPVDAIPEGIAMHAARDQTLVDTPPAPGAALAPPGTDIRPSSGIDTAAPAAISPALRPLGLPAARVVLGSRTMFAVIRTGGKQYRVTPNA